MINTRMKEPTFDRSGSPTYETLSFIENFNCTGRANREWLFRFVSGCWNTDYGTVRRTSEGGVEFVTGGWSDNEAVITSMRANIELWAICFIGSAKGGVWRFAPGREG